MPRLSELRSLTAGAPFCSVAGVWVESVKTVSFKTYRAEAPVVNSRGGDAEALEVSRLRTQRVARGAVHVDGVPTVTADQVRCRAMARNLVNLILY
ncbi:hypothetical protein GCM10010405_61210 [Streptomyces macrosporus]|uniref:Uncharacterized protein n=1 Tax=Streptomyces macrosporus TaxID=44032 RepID=A0ABN3KNY4_9ACTN